MKEMFRRFQPLMDADDGLDIPNNDGDETSAETEEVAEPLDNEESEEKEEVADLPENKSDSAFAQMRREKQELERKLAELEAERDEYNETLGLFFDGDDKIAQAQAHYNNISVEEARERVDAKRAETSLKQENEDLHAQLDELQYKQQKLDDLAEIKAKYPDAKIKDVEELGEEFFAYRAMGIPASEVYNGLQMKKSKPPKSMGKPKTAPAEKSYFTKEEVDAMSKSEVSKNFEKIRASMSKWE